MTLSYKDARGEESVHLAATPLFEEIFAQERYAQAFDAILLATQTGRVLVATAHSRDRLRIHDLSALIMPPPPPSTVTADAIFQRLAQSTNLLDVNANGSAHKLFIQPCCGVLQGRIVGAPAGASSAPSETLPQFVVAGLVSTARLRAESMAISFSVIVGVGAVLLLAVIGAPFLKLVMIHDTDRVTPTHALQLATSCIGGLAVLTLFLLDWHAYTRLNRRVDDQLAQLSTRIKASVHDELTLASQQLRCLIDGTARYTPTAKENVVVRDSLGSSYCRKNDYPQYEVFALVDDQGQQRFKLVTDEWATAFVRVADRPYFKAALNGKVWAAPALAMAEPSGRGGYVESVRSWTNGKLRAVIAAPTGNKALPVAMLTIPLQSLISPVLISGFAFAVVDTAGTVLFHSDAQRNLNEQLFVEADANRRLRAAVVARQSKPINLRYWGQQHRAYVTPVGDGIPWALVALHEKRPLWTLQEEWLVVSLGFLAIYMMELMVLLAALVVGHRTHHAAWIWPQASRRLAYRQVVMVQAALVIAFIASIGTLTGWSLAMVGLLAPIGVCLVTFGILQRQSTAVPTANRVVPLYILAGVLTTILVAVMPAAAFFKAAHDIHTDNYLKHRQLRLAQSMVERQRLQQADHDRAPRQKRDAVRTAETSRAMAGDAPTSPEKSGFERGIYYDFFFSTSQAREPEHLQPALAERLGCAIDRGEAAEALDPVPAFLEDWLPYQSEASVEMRELIHDGGPADEWSWGRGRTGTGDCLALRFGHGEVMRIVSQPHRWSPPGPTTYFAGTSAGVALAAGARSAAEPDTRAATRSDAHPAAGAWGALQFVIVALALIVACYAAVRFICRRIFLVRLDTSGWRFNPDLSPSGESMVMVGRTDAPKDLNCHVVNLARLVATPSAPSGADPGAPVRDPWREELANVDSTEAPNIAITNIDCRVYDPVLAEKKLEFIEQVVLRQNRPVVLTSKKSIREITEAIPRLRDRWDILFSSFIVGDYLGQGERPAASPDPSGSARRPQAGPLTLIWRLLMGPDRRDAWAELRHPVVEVTRSRGERHRRHLHALLVEESNADPVVGRICGNIKKELDTTAGLWETLTADELLDQIGRRAGAHYRRLWVGCTGQEKLLLSHIAQDGLVNAKASSVVRRLTTKGLIRACPDFRLMNRSFERFILSGEQHLERVVCESKRQASTWDRFQWPFAAALAGGCLFFVVTQKELFDSTIASLGALATAIPAVVKAIGLSRDATTTASASEPEAPSAV